ncbi:glycoside hydrolase family 2 protein [Streptosporangium fragile]|uniref:beta-mannosidase n=1 Tax=Streptosporangium fragile TaxID=46186 RepID=A0ABP6IFW3_9ACTN
MTFHELSRGWTVRARSGPVPAELRPRLSAGVPAEVPGVVHTDLLSAGLIPDPHVDENESLLSWIGLTTWEYSATFDWRGGDGARHDLVAEGLDTVATVVLNGTEVARTVNQHRGYRWNVSSLLREGANEIRVTFDSAIGYAREQEKILGERPHSYHHPYNAVRKMACNFGWDWGPDVVTAGIWRRIGVESWSRARLASVRPLTSVTGDAGGGGTITAAVEIEWERPGLTGPVSLTVEAAGRTASVPVVPGAGTRDRAEAVLRLDGVELWWPRGHGAQPLYPVSVTLRDDTDDTDGADGADDTDGTAGAASPDGAAAPKGPDPVAGPLSEWSGRVGFRTVEVDLTPDPDGSPFTFRINGEPVYVRGANWIPDDTFLPRVTRASLERAVGEAVASNMNLLRVWGGGVYESEDFYDICDEQGILVWQDFLLACAAYAEDPPLYAEFEAEAREAVTRLAAHPSLVLWNGGNENIWGYADWNWRSRLGSLTWGEAYYVDLFPRVVAELAPGTPYSPGSPFSFSRYLHPNDPAHGLTHIWDVWNTRDYGVYRDYRPRFVSEFGFQGPATWATLSSAVHDDPPSPSGPAMLAHQKARDGNGKLARGLRGHLPEPESIDDWHWATQLNQARAVAFGIEHFRSLFPLNTGAVVWQLNDCWPAVSWAAVDGRGRRKPLWYALRRVYADRLATVQPRPDGLALVVHNDGPEPMATTATARRMTLAGAELAVARFDVRVEARAAARVTLAPGLAEPGDVSGELLVVDLASGQRAFWYFAEDVDLALDPGALDAAAEAADGGYLVRVRASSLVKDVTLLADRLAADAEVDEALVTLLPGESFRFRVSTAERLEEAALTARPVLRSANDLVGRARPAAT